MHGTATTLDAELERAELTLPADVRKRLALYAAELERWNRTVNLTALSGARLVRRLIVDPVRIGLNLQMSRSLADVGSGNGSPGVPLGIALGLQEVHLIEPRERRAAFLRHLSISLKLKEVSVDCCRLEDMVPGFPAVDWITLQALSPTPPLLNAMRSFAHGTTNVVWFRPRNSPLDARGRRIELAESEVEAQVFQLDQS